MLLLTLGASQLIRLASVQTYLTQLATNYLKDEFDLEASIGEVDLQFPFDLRLQNVLVLDHKQDTLLFASKLQTDLISLDQNFEAFDFGHLYLSDVVFNLIQYQGDSLTNLGFVLQNFKTSDTSSAVTPTFTAGVIKLNNVRFKYDVQDKLPQDTVIDWSHLGLIGNASIANLNYANSILHAKIEGIDLAEKSGFQLDQLSSELFLSNNHVVLRNFMLNTPNSNLNGNIKLMHNEWVNYQNFVKDVPFSIDLKEGSQLNIQDLGYFASVFYQKNQLAKIQGNVHGTVNNLITEELLFWFGEHSHFHLDFKLKGLPNFYHTFFDAHVKDLDFYPHDFEELLQTFSPNVKFPEELLALGLVDFNGFVDGFLEDLFLEGEFNTEIGNLKADANLKLNEKGEGEFKGDFYSIGLELGALLPKNVGLNALALKGEIEGHFDDENFGLDINSNFPFINYQGYNYKDLKVDGVVESKSFKGILSIYDENLTLIFNGSVDLNQTPNRYLFTSAITKANLTKLNFIEDEREHILSGTFLIDLFGNDLNHLQGKATLGNVNYLVGDDRQKLKSLYLTAQQFDTTSVYTITSDNLEGNLSGNIDFLKLKEHFEYEIFTALPYLTNKPIKKPKAVEDFNLNLKVFNPTFLGKVFLENLEILKPIDINLNFNSLDEKMKLLVDIPELNYNTYRSSNSKIEGNLSNGIADITLNANRIAVSDSLSFDNVLLKGKSVGRKLQTDVSWQGNSGTSTSGNISGLIDFISTKNIAASFFNTSLIIEDQKWSLNPDNEVLLLDSNIYFKNFDFTNNNQKISLLGAISTNPNTALNLKFNQFDLSNINRITKSTDFRIYGLVDGTATVKDYYKNLIFQSDIVFDSLNINNQDFGNGSLSSIWKDETKSVELTGVINSETGQKFKVFGSYFPFNPEEQLDLSVNIRGFELATLQPFLVEYLSTFSGNALGNLKIKGSLKTPIITGKLNFIDTYAKVDYLNSAYLIKNEVFKIEPDWMGFDYITITDERGNDAKAVGTIFHENYSNFNFDISLFTKNFQLLNTNEKQNDLYYGKAYASGDINISGFADNLLMEINAKSEKGTKLYLPLSGPSSVNSSGYITYVQSWDVQPDEEEEEVDLSGIQMDFNLEVDENAEIQIIFDETVGDVMKAKGEGDMQMKINTNGEFLMYGEYTVTDGDYLFTLQNIINKRFRVKRGGTITWNGDPYEANLNLTAIYTTRAPLVDLGLPIDSSAAKRKVPVNVELMMKNKFMNPDLSFNINLPNADENTQSLVSSSMQTEEELNKQVFSLMLINKFSPPESGLQTGGAVGATSSELLANQLTNWLSKSKLNDYLEIGFNELSADEVEVALTKRLFNNRMVIEGNFGSTSPTSTDGIENAQSNNIVGDFNVEYAIRKDGKLKARAYRRSNDFNMVNNNFAPYTEGIGFFYREDFDSWKDAFRKVFKRDKD